MKNLPGSELDVTYTYDLLNRMTSASQTGNALSFTWDALSRRLTEVGPQGTVTSEYDLAGRRTRVTLPGATSLFADYDYLLTGEVTAIRENGATSGVGVLATYAYDNLGNRLSVTFGNGVVQNYTYDPVSRLASLSNDLSGTTNDLSATFAYNPASQITSTVRTGDTYAWTGHGTGSTAFVSNGLNQQTSIGGSAATWDSKGNLTSEPQSGKAYTYSSENLLKTASGGVTLAYDPGLRLYQVAGAATTRFAYDGVNAIAEYDGANALQRRFVFGPGIDAPIVQYEGTGTTDRRFLSADERGSIISLTDSAGALLNINRYDEYGKPQSTNAGRFQYTGQKWIGEAGLYDYKFRMYAPQLGIFAQTDPIGYEDSSNLYAYVLDDPVNFFDPFGMRIVCVQEPHSLHNKCEKVADEDGDGDVDGADAAAATAWLNFQFSNPQFFYSNSPELLAFEQANRDFLQQQNEGQVHFQDTAMTRAMDRDAREYLTGKISEQEFQARAQARGVGIAGGTAFWVAVFTLRAGAMAATSPSGVLFGDTAFGASRQGLLNQGFIRVGYGRGGGVANFRVGVGNYKVDLWTKRIPSGR